MQSDPEKTPLFKNWNYWYAITLFILVSQIIIYFLITQKYK